MKINKYFLFLFAATIFASCGSSSEEELVGNWVKLGDFDGPARGHSCSFVIGDTAYICTGYNKKSLHLNDLWRYNAGDKTWKKRKDFPGSPRLGATAFTVNGKGYVGLGTDGRISFKDFWEYDPKTDNWTELEAVFPGEARFYAVGAGLKGKGYVGTGFDEASRFKDFYSYTPSGTPGRGSWEQINSFEGSKRSGAAVFVIGEKLYLFGGISNETTPTDMQRFDPVSGNWEKILDLMNTDKTEDDDNYDKISRSYGVTFVIGGKGYIALGENAGSQNTTVYEYDPATNKWTQRTSHPRNRSYSIGFGLPETNPTRGFTVTGRLGDSWFDDFREFKPLDVNDAYDD